MVALIDTTSPSLIKARIFFAFSSADLSDSESNYEKLIFNGLKRENVSTCTLTDYVFFDIRFVKPLEKYFHDNQMIKSEGDNFFQQMEQTGIFLFQQPFLMIHLAFKLPTAMLEWQLSMKKKQPVQDYWAHIYSAEQQNIPNDINFEPAGENNSALGISYHLPNQSDMYSSRGVMLVYNESFSNDDERLNIIDRILSGEIIHEDSGTKLSFPLTRVYVVNNANSSGIRIAPVAGTYFNEVSLVNRVNAREKGIFFSWDSLITTFDTNKPDKAIQTYSLFKQSSDKKSFDVRIVEDYNESTGFHKLVPELTRITRLIHLLRVILVGIIIWMLFFIFFHRKVLVGFNLWGKIKISLLAYLVYVLIATIFSFMFGFGFVLGIFAMESAIKRNFNESPTSRLFLCGLLTSFFTALTAFLFL